jgi:DNA-binding MarR family transcriptional regulator
MAADRPRLSASARYCLEVLSRGPRSYSTKNLHVRVLERRGFVEALPNEATEDARRWAITDAGREALKSYAEPRGTAVTRSEERLRLRARI